MARGRDSGLTTLEWLLVVASVAGLAALAVVLVQSVVGTTAEGVKSHSARQEALDLATTELTLKWQAEVPESPEEAAEINRRYEARCRTLGIIYPDVSLSTTPHPWQHARGMWIMPSCSLG